MDADENGKVSHAEFIAGGKAQFQVADTDNHGKLTPRDFRAEH